MRCALVLPILLVAGCAGTLDPALLGPDPAAAARVAAWRDDLRALVAGIEARHPDPYRRLPAAAFAADAATLAAELPRLGNEAVVVAFAELVARLGDGHTTVAIDSWAGPASRLPLAIAWCDDGPFVQAIAAPQAELLGRRVLAIGDRSFADAVAAVTRTTALDNEPARRAFAAGLLTDLRVLHATGVAPRREAVAIRVGAADGSERVVELAAATPTTAWVSSPPAAGVPATLRRHEAWFWWQALAGTDAVYLRADRCATGASAGAEFALVAAEVDDHLRRHPGTRLVVDLRTNPGGNDKVLDPVFELARTHDWLRQRGNLLVLVGRRTFSSAGLVALWLRERCGAVLVGQPTGMKPNGFGQVRDFVLPHSRVLVHCSTREFRFVPVGDPPSVEPDVAVALPSRAVLAGEDVVLAAALAVARAR